VSLPLSEVDLRAAAGQEAALSALAESVMARGFAPGEAPLMALTLARLSEAEHVLIWTHHHVLLDGWSAAQLLSEVLRSYAGETLPARRGRYRDHIAWLLARDGADDAAFWRPRLASLSSPTFLRSALGLTADDEGEAREHLVSWSVEDTAALTAFARSARVTVNTLVQAAWTLLLSRYTGSRTVAFGVTVAGRPAEVPGADALLGLFINTVPVIQTLAGGVSVGAYLEALQAENLSIREHEQTSLADIQRWAGRPGQPLFDSLLVFENYPIDELLAERAQADLQFGKVAAEGRTNYALTLEVSVAETLTLCYEYRSGAFSGELVSQVAEHVNALLRALMQSTQRALGTLPMLGEVEAAATLRRAQGVSAPVTPGRLEARFVAQVRATPHQRAVEFGAASLTYAALNARANQLAHRLRALGVGPNVLVGLCVERSLELVVGVLGILKAGGGYVPLDPSA
jgi:hypothetical protein